MQNFEKGHFFHKSQKNFFLFFMGDESPNAHESKKLTGTLPKVDLNVDNFEIWMTVMSAVEQMEQVQSWILTHGH